MSNKTQKMLKRINQKLNNIEKENLVFNIGKLV